MSARWHLDAGVLDMIQYLDQPKYKYHPEALTPKIMRAVETEMRKCQQDFEYAARNYFWITDKRGEDIPFRLWESQELILEHFYRLRRKRRAQKLMILKSRQLGCSTLIEALVAWRTMFFPNISALVVSVNREHSAFLFGKMLHILDRMPWWLTPAVAARKYEDGLWFENPDETKRRDYPGLNSRVTVQAANQMSGIGQGRNLGAVHISEGADWLQDVHKRTMEGDLQYALAENEETFAFWESTAKGAGTYTEDLWLANMKLGERAEWHPIFLPWFFEATRVLPPPQGWSIHPKEAGIRQRIYKDWVRCDNPECGQFRENHPFKGITLEEETCPACSTGTLRNYILGDGQMYWMEGQRINKEAKGPDAIRELKAELCSTPQEAFQIHGLQVFPESCQEWVNACLESPKAVGDLDVKGNFHGVKNPEHDSHCWQEWCTQDHRYEESYPLEIWEWPRPNEQYVVGVDVAEGLGGRSDYSVAWINRIGRPGSPDVQVAMYRSNTMTPMAFAEPVNYLGRWYNDALMSIEYNGTAGPGCAITIQQRLQYPNLFRWKHYDSFRTLSNKWHWYTQVNTKPLLWQTGRRWLQARQWIVKSEIFYEEMLRFQKTTYEEKSAGAEDGYHDDAIMSALIAMWTSHDMDWDEQTQTIPIRQENNMATSLDWTMRCTRCGHTWGAQNPEREGKCFSCGSRYLSAKPNSEQGLKRTLDWGEIEGIPAGAGEARDFASL